MPKTFYVTTPIYYVNDAPHLGHAYTTVAADVVARWRRQRGEDVFFLTGTDEHGQKILRTAESHGVTPQQWCDRLVEQEWKPLWEHLQISNDDFIRTTDARHEDRVREFVKALRDGGSIREGKYEGFYCVGCEEFKTESDLLAPEQGSPESESGLKLCPIHKKPVEWLEETNYFFQLSAFQERLLEHYESHPGFVSPASAYNEVTQFVRQGLEDLSISRSSFDWGIPVPWDPSQVIYVWVDALLNYASAVGYGESSSRAERDLFSAAFPADVHLVGKDILRFHAVIWPALLMAAGLPLPDMVKANGWLLVGGEKMSKSNLTGISPRQLTEEFGVDAFRYYFLRAVPFGSDGSFSWEDFSARYHSELANGLGNLASRVTAMVVKYFGGTLPQPGPDTETEARLAKAAHEVLGRAEKAVDEVALHEVLAAIFSLVDVLNGYVTEREPWKVAKADDEASQRHLATTLYQCCEGLRRLAVLLNPVMPDTAAQLWASVGAEGELAQARPADLLKPGSRLRPGATVTKVSALFPRKDQD